MGFTLGIETKPEMKCPFWFTKTDSKQLFDVLLVRHLWQAGDDDDDVVGMIQEHTGVDFAPLLKVAATALDPEEYPSKKEWEKQNRKNEAAWQDPAQLEAFLAGLLAELERRPRLFSELELSKGDQRYFAKGLFRSDIEDLRRMAAWAKQRGARKMRLVGD